MYSSLPYSSTLSIEASLSTQFILPIADGLFYANIALFWLYVLIVLCRVNSPKMRIFINFSQFFALILSFPYLFDQISYAFLNSLNSYNFTYFSSLVTCNSGNCILFAYLWQPLIALPCFIGCFLISYFVFGLCYRSSLIQSLGFFNYFKQSWFLVLYLFVDWTAIKFGLNMGKAVKISDWGWLIAGLWMVVILVVSIGVFKLINREEQLKIVYRAKNSWAYGYDQNFHLHYIDFLYTSSHQIPADRQMATQTIIPVKTSQNTRVKRKGMSKMFFPHSNLLIFELIFKFALGFLTMMQYQQIPSLITICLTLLLWVTVFWVGAFMYYDKLTLLIYTILIIVFLAVSGIYWTTYFWLVSMVIGFSLTISIGLSFVLLFIINSKIKNKLVNKMFVEEDERNMIIRHTQSNHNADPHEDDKMDLQNSINIEHEETNNHLNNGKLESVISPAQKSIKKEPFVGNLTRKTISKTQTIIQTSENLRPLENDLQKITKPPSKAIFLESMTGEIASQEQTIVRHSQFKSRMRKNKTPISFEQTIENNDQDFMPNILQEEVEKSQK